MAQICYSVAVSLDGFIAGPNGEADWIALDPDIDFAGIWSRFDTLLMGRRTYEVAITRFGTSGFQGKRVLVVSRTWPREGAVQATVLRSVDQSTLASVRAQATQDIWLMGGGELFSSLLLLGEVDQVEVMIVPVLLGSGTPLAGHLPKRANLNLRAHRV